VRLGLQSFKNFHGLKVGWVGLVSNAGGAAMSRKATQPNGNSEFKKTKLAAGGGDEEQRN